MPDRLKLLLLNVYFYLLFLISSATVIPVLTVFVICSRPFSTRRGTMKRFRRAINWYGRVVMALPFPFIRIRYEQIDPVHSGESCIFVCNHRSTSDAFLIGLLPEEIIQIVNVWPFKIPVLGVYAKYSGYLNIRMMSPEQFMGKAKAMLDEGISIVFFPEGTRSTSGKMGAFNSAAFRLAFEAKAAIVPLCITGNEQIPPKGSLWLRPGTIRVRRLPAIPWSEYRDLTSFAFKNRVWKIMDRELDVMEGRG
jgi:1-acyl-sn-glycerol-3-phosphate acyltransferase